MRSFLFLALMLLFSCALSAQARIAIVSGTTNQLKTTASLDSALDMASDGDFIYLPGATYPSATINKRVFIFGAGTYPDSTGTTGRTVIGTIYVRGAASGGLLEGCTVSGSLELSSTPVENFIVKRCNINQLTDQGNSNFFIENIIRVKDGNSTYGTYQKNLIGGINYERYGNFQNNIFYNLGALMSFVGYCTFQNNIFLSLDGLPGSSVYNSWSNYSNYFYNNLTRIDIPDDQFNLGNTTTTLDKMFVKFDSTFTNFYTQDFHLKADSPGKDSGSDGTDVGIYGTNEPTKEGWVPSNPHISLKNISSQTDANGNLKATFKVKAQNN